MLWIDLTDTLVAAAVRSATDDFFRVIATDFFISKNFLTLFTMCFDCKFNLTPFPGLLATLCSSGSFELHWELDCFVLLITVINESTEVLNPLGAVYCEKLRLAERRLPLQQAKMVTYTTW